MRVKIIGRNHPHAGEYGERTNERITTPTGTEMTKVILENCPQGVDACFVTDKEMRPARENEEYE